MTLIHPFSWAPDEDLSRMMSWMGGRDSKAVQFLSPIPRLVFWCWRRICVCLVHTVRPDVHTYLWDHSQHLCLTWAAFSLKATLSHRVFWFHWFIIFPEMSQSVERKKKSSSALLICHEPDGLCDMARNDSEIIFSFLCLKSTAHQIAQTAVALGSQNLLRVKLSWPCYINITMYFLVMPSKLTSKRKLGWEGIY